MSKDNVVFLAYRNETPTDSIETLACTACKNKTWIARYYPQDDFPTMVCACCGQHSGKFGWVEE